MSLFLCVALLSFAAEGLRTRAGIGINPPGRAGGPADEDFTFDAFVRDFERAYEAGGEEYLRRGALFRDSLAQIRAKNSRADRSWTAGVHPFMDWTDAERAGRLHGYVFTGSRRAEQTDLAAVQTRAGASERLYGEDGDDFEAAAPPVRNQGLCGSCWAISSVEAVEAQLLRANSSLSFQHGKERLSPQAVLDCVQNPKHCGGAGGCDGATPQLAFEFMRDNGLPLEADVPYKMGTDDCPMHEAWPSNRPRATVQGWQELPSNQAQPLMRAIVELGPVAVSVAAQAWYPYRLGIYDECAKDCVPNHSVLAKGYGSEDGLGKYWLLQNSWGSKWGEQGAIRIRRNQDEDQWCGTDIQPQLGSSCDGGPASVTVCGSCGILYDSVMPQGARLVFPERPGAEDFRDVVSESSADLMLSSYPAAATAIAPAVREAPRLAMSHDYDDMGASHAANRTLSAYGGGSEFATEARHFAEAHTDRLPNLEAPEHASSESRTFAFRVDGLASPAPASNNFRDTMEAMAEDDMHFAGRPSEVKKQDSFVPMTSDSSFHDASGVLDA